jgi:hypothetical protein
VHPYRRNDDRAAPLSPKPAAEPWGFTPTHLQRAKPQAGIIGMRSFFLIALLSVSLVHAGDGATTITLNEKSNTRAHFWLASSMVRIFNQTAPGEPSIDLLSARNGRIAFQACLRNESMAPLTVECSVIGADDLHPQIRYVGMVPMHHLTPNTALAELDGVEHLPGFVPDPLWPMSKVWIGPNESRSFWITLNVPADAKPGVRELIVRMNLPEAKKQIDLPVRLDIAELVIQPRKDFHVIHWWRGEATWDFYKTGMFEDPRWWKLTRDQLADMLAHGSDVVYVPIFFDRRETFKRPCQLLIVNETEPGKYTFDWSQVKKFTDMCKELGFTEFEWSHLWIYWGVENPVRLYTRKGDQYVMLWDPSISGFSDTFLNFLKQFLPEFEKFLKQETLLDHSYFHLSDEPGSGQHIANYKRARQILHDLAPWMKVMDALSDIEYGKQHLTDMPVPLVSSAQAYIDLKIPHWVYYCCAPQGPWLNRFMDTPLAKVRMSGMLFYRLGAKGFLHWGFNYWHKMEQETIGDPFNDATNAGYPGIPYGDPFVIYPGPDGPLDSIRWEVFAESLQDYAILQSAGIKPDDPLLADVKSYKDFPRDEQWIARTMRAILKGRN